MSAQLKVVEKDSMDNRGKALDAALASSLAGADDFHAENDHHLARFVEALRTSLAADGRRLIQGPAPLV